MKCQRNSKHQRKLHPSMFDKFSRKPLHGQIHLWVIQKHFRIHLRLTYHHLPETCKESKTISWNVGDDKTWPNTRPFKHLSKQIKNWIEQLHNKYNQLEVANMNHLAEQCNIKKLFWKDQGSILKELNIKHCDTSKLLNHSQKLFNPVCTNNVPLT